MLWPVARQVKEGERKMATRTQSRARTTALATRSDAPLVAGDRYPSPIKVMFVKLAEPTQVTNLSNVVSLSQFLERRGESLSPSIRVNRQVRGGDYVLQDGDIISKVTKVSGG
jgi:molybdopterin converting factor small subunit